MINDGLAGNTLATLRGRSVKKTFVHVLAVEHIIDVTPSGFVVAQVVLIEHPASLPVAHNELLKDYWFHHWDVDPPLSEPSGTLNEKRCVTLSTEH